MEIFTEHLLNQNLQPVWIGAEVGGSLVVLGWAGPCEDSLDPKDRGSGNVSAEELHSLRRLIWR